LTSMPPSGNRIKVPVLLGPTSSGKTELAIGMAQELGAEIISCDSRQVYRYMDIGTAKPTAGELRLVRHWMIDIVEPDRTFSSYQFAREAGEIIRRRTEAGKILFLCGGSGLYFKILCDGIGPSVEPDAEFRIRYAEKARLLGNQSIFEELMGVDPLTAARSSPSNVQRNIRALEIYYGAGIPLSELKTRARPPEDIDFFVMVTTPAREALYQWIDGRVDVMVKNGLFEEFRLLRGRGYDATSPGMQCLGYKELFAVERGLMPFRGAVDLIKKNTRHYAKRQITWFKHQVRPPVVPVESGSPAKVRNLLREFLRP
jgi:tRNA dimethylallyltransferase